MSDFASSSEDKLFYSRIDDMIRLSDKKGAVYSSFLNEKECANAQRRLESFGCKNFRFYGVFNDPARKMLCVYREYFEPCDDDFPIDCLTFVFKNEGKLSHRDFLGALMALGIKRETVGDIVIEGTTAQIAVCRAVKNVIVNDIKKIGSEGVKYKEDFVGILEKRQDFKEIDGTVQSMRLDAVAGLALGLSRTKTAALIKSAGAEVNFVLRNDCSFILSEQDVFSIRGFGKFIVAENSGITKKGRIHIKVLKYC